MGRKSAGKRRVGKSPSGIRRTSQVKDRVAALEKRKKELEALRNVARSLTGELMLSKLLDNIMKKVCQLMRVEISSLRLLGEGGEGLILAASHGLSPAYQRKGAVRIGKSVVGRVVKEKKILTVRDLRSDPFYQYRNSARREKLESLLSAPLVYKGKAIGAITVYSRAPRDFRAQEKQLLLDFAQLAAVAIGNAFLVEKLRHHYLGTMRALASLIDARDPHARGHSERVAEYARKLAEEVGLSSARAEVLEQAAMLHDIGKISIQDNILTKKGGLTKKEWKMMRYHADWGGEILKMLPFLKPAATYIRHHHERYDGGGYPGKLRGKAVPLEARILCLADAYDAMLSQRPYRKCLTPEEAEEELLKHSGSQFDPVLVKAFLRALSQRKRKQSSRKGKRSRKR